MSVFVAFLRGMNLGRRRIKNDELCAAFRTLGCAEVSAFLASGNVIFSDPDGGTASEVTSRIEDGLRRILEYEVPTFLRSAEEVRAIAERVPFTSEQVDAGGKPQVMLFDREPPAVVRRNVLGLSTSDDRLVLDRRELYWLPRASILDSELDLAAIERALGTTTMRTKRTLERLIAKLPSH